MTREARKALCFSAIRASVGKTFRIERARAAHVDIEAGVGRGRLDVERLAGGFEHFGDRPGRPKRAAKPGRQDRAAVDGDDVVRARRCEADLQNIMGAAPRMQHRAPAACAMGVDQIADRRHNICLRQCLHHQRAFPQVVFGQRPVLQRAAAAGTEMLANRLGALVAGPVDMHQMPAVGMAGDRSRP